MILQFPINYIVVTGGYSGRHQAIDFGWFKSKPSTKHQDIVAIADGVVFDKKVLRDGGNSIYTRHEGKNNTWYGAYMHLARPSHLKIGDKVKAGQKLGTMGDTGESFGNHLHFILWKGPKGYKLNTYDRTYRVNPLDFLKRLPHQEDRDNRFPIYTGSGAVSGDKVTVKSSAKKFTTGETMANWVKGSTFDVLQKGKGQTLISRGGTAIGWVSNSDLVGSKEDKPVPKPPSGKRYFNIDRGSRYGVYRLGVRPVVKNIDKYLRPDKFGGMSYEIVSNTSYPDVFIIETRDFGKRQIYLDKSQASITSKPKYKVYGKGSSSNDKKPPKKTRVGKYANFKGKVRLFKEKHGDACWHTDEDKNLKNNKYTNVRPTSAKILKEGNGRVYVSVPRFDPQKVWIANSESTVTDKPLYKA